MILSGAHCTHFSYETLVFTIYVYVAPTAPPSRLYIVSYTSTTISLTWEPPPAEHVNGILRHYTVGYLEQDTVLEFSVISNTTSLQLMDLHPYFTYIIRVRAETVSPGPFSYSQSVRLPEDGMLCDILWFNIDHGFIHHCSSICQCSRSFC